MISSAAIRLAAQTIGAAINTAPTAAPAWSSPFASSESDRALAHWLAKPPTTSTAANRARDNSVCSRQITFSSREVAASDLRQPLPLLVADLIQCRDDGVFERVFAPAFRPGAQFAAQYRPQNAIGGCRCLVQPRDHRLD